MITEFGNKEASPCLDCKDRWINENGRCHSTCEKYIEFTKRVKAITREINDERKRSTVDPIRLLKTEAQKNRLQKARRK